MGFEHHVAMNISQKADAIAEALDNYMGWDVYRHPDLSGFAEGVRK
jgi:hypothetical protein